MRNCLNFISGEMRSAVSNEYVEKLSPINGKLDYLVARSNKADLEVTVSIAKSGFSIWSEVPLEERIEVLLTTAKLLKENLDFFAEIETKDTGKPIKLSKTLDIPRAVQNFEFFCEWIKSQSHETYLMGMQSSSVFRQPLGIVGLITPWNLPIYLLTWKLAPALLMGNSVIAKPSELTPQTATQLGLLLKQAGLPNGVYNVLNGLGAEIGDALVSHPDVNAISFTGGTSSGRQVALAAAEKLKRVSLELGGKNPAIVFADCDLERTVDGLLRACFLNQGEICLCASRLLIEESIYDQFKVLFLKKLTLFKVDDPFLEDTNMGALISKSHLAKIEKAVESSKQLGGKILIGGQRVQPSSQLESGYFYAPTVIEGLDHSTSVVKEEIFGPVVTLHPFTSESEALSMSNDVVYGLAASIWTENKERALRIAKQVKAGTVWINSWLVRDLRTPFGGMKMSGLGREGGNHSLDFFSDVQTISSFEKEVSLK